MKPDWKVLIVAPHPDDGEALAHQICVQAVKAGNQVHQLLATCDEYGTHNDRFKGKRIQRIRRKEMFDAAKAYGVDDKGNAIVKVHWMNYIDCHVPFNAKSVKRFRNFIKKLKPSIIIGPDPFFEFDGHSDHIKTGWNYYFALKGLKSTERPKLMLFFQTTKPNIFLPLKHMDIVKKARAAHKSQFSPIILKLMNLMNIFFSIITSVKTGGRLTQGYRKLVFSIEKNEINSVIHKLLYYFIGKFGDEASLRTPPYPEEFGFELEPKNDIL